MSPQIIIAAALTLAGFGSAWQIQGWRYSAKDAERVEQQQRDARRQITMADKAAGGYEVDRVRTKTEFVTITERVDHVIQSPVYRNVCFDADGLRVLADAAATTAADPASPGSPVSGPAPTQ